jgi:DNA ligase-1
LGHVAKVLVDKGLGAVKELKIVVGKPIRMMLAQRLSTAEEVAKKLDGKCSAEYKLDGERLQIHKRGSDVHIFSRRLEKITYMYPDVRDMAEAHIKAEEAVVEGEAVAVNPKTNEFRPFQILMQRRRKYRINEMVKKIPIAVFLFDCLYSDGKDLTLTPYPNRRKRLREIVKEDSRFQITKSLESSDPKEMEYFFDESILEGSEGLIVKSTSDNSFYQAGARSWLWVKLKRSYQSKMVEPVDLVAVGAFYGRGRRAGSYGALLVAAYDREGDSFKTVCKVGSGFTDEDLAMMPDFFQDHIIPNKPPRVDALIEPDTWFNPSVVMEVVGDEITISPIHTCAYNVLRENSGLAVRFPRFTGRWRSDKALDDATTVNEIVDMYKAQLKKIDVRQ